jgi:hypothetical protein
VQTVPALASVRFLFDGAVLTTGADGRAGYTAEHNLRAHSLTLVDTSIVTPERRYRFARWAGQRDPNQAFQPVVTGLPMRANYTITVAFAVQYPVAARFVDQHGHPLDLGPAAKMTIKSDTGELLDLPESGPVWLDGTRPVYRESALSTVDVSYSLQRVVVDGANLVDAGRQKFQPVRTTAPTFAVQFHDVTITAHDALFGGPVGTHAVVTFPGGGRRTVPFGPDHSVTLNNMPRGVYQASVKAGHATVFAEQFDLSRPRTINVMVVTRRDLAVLMVTVLVAAVVPMLLGEARWRWYLHAPVARRLRMFRSIRTLRRLRKRVSTA